MAEIPSWADLAQILTALAAVGAFILSWWNSRKIEEVRHATNSMKDELVAEVRDASLAKGLKQGREERNPRRK